MSRRQPGVVRLAVRITSTIVVLCAGVSEAGAQQSVIFEGVPIRSVAVSPFGVSEEEIAQGSRLESQVQIVQVDGRYYWSSRGMKELVGSTSGAYVTFHAIDGAGYVRVFAPALGEDPRLTPPSGDGGPTYMEHLLLTLGSLTYYGYGK